MVLPGDQGAIAIGPGDLLDLTVFADCGGFAIALDAGCGDAESRDGAQGEQFAQFLADVHEL